MAGRTHVLPDDVKAVAIPCLAHRLLLQPDQWVRGVRTEQVVAEVVSQVPAPTAVDPGDTVGAPGDGVGLLGQPAGWPPRPPMPPGPPGPARWPG
jgi:hypothetical protein